MLFFLFAFRAALVLFVVLFIRFLVQLPGNDAIPAVKGRQFMDTVIIAITMIVVAIPGRHVLTTTRYHSVFG